MAAARFRPLARGRRTAPAYRWERLDDAALLQLRLCDLGLRVQRSAGLSRCIERLYGELAARGIRFRPHVWLAEEWFSPDGVPGIAIPFYLAHPRLRSLERRITHEAEGSNTPWLMRLLRHEAGHAIDNAYRLRRRARWRAVFGPASQPYRAWYRARPASRHHVQHLGDWYAQSHPTEDFAETFATWLQPRADWRQRYAGWPAMRKLRFVEQIAAEIGAQPAPVRTRERIEPLADSTRTLAQHYRHKLAWLARRRRALADAILRRAFPPGAARGPLAAATLLRTHKQALVRSLVRASGFNRYSVYQIVRMAIERCERLGLRVGTPRRQALRRARAALLHLVHAYGRSEALRVTA
ncbi:MAG: putative zinc-binding metallopeptidase [Gammaproteobacteria bacterium]|nr:putative zinc-binding metallopeptidase [Gammaproteobacteria bacterium]